MWEVLVALLPLTRDEGSVRRCEGKTMLASARVSSHLWEGATLVAPATGVAGDGWPGIPRPAPYGGALPVTFRRRRVSPLPCLLFSATS